MPQLDFSTVRPGRGRHAARAAASLDVIVVDKRLSEAVGGVDRLTQILAAVTQVLVPETTPRRTRRPVKRSPRSSHKKT